jgi:iron(III) transport system permease protein
MDPPEFARRSALLQQIDRSLDEASGGLALAAARRFGRVTLPLILPAFFAGLGVVFIRSMTAISATIFPRVDRCGR